MKEERKRGREGGREEFGKAVCPKGRLQMYMLILRLRLSKCNNQVAQGMQWPHAICNYMRKERSRYQHVPPKSKTRREDGEKEN